MILTAMKSRKRNNNLKHGEIHTSVNEFATLRALTQTMSLLVVVLE